MNSFLKVFKTIISAFFPNTCIACGDIIDEGENLCNYCYEMLEKCDCLKRCIKCGQKKGICDCKYRVYRFEGCISPFYSNDISLKAMYKLKFGKNIRNADFFAEQMAICIKIEYSDIKFDEICYVPLSARNELKRGFNQSKILAERISKITGIKLSDGVLKCKKSSASQHSLSLNERFNHVKGLYSCDLNLSGKTILLIDDIKTTGATLDECSKQLLLCGASKIYCATAIIVKENKKNVS